MPRTEIQSAYHHYKCLVRFSLTLTRRNINQRCSEGTSYRKKEMILGEYWSQVLSSVWHLVQAIRDSEVTCFLYLVSLFDSFQKNED